MIDFFCMTTNFLYHRLTNNYPPRCDRTSLIYPDRSSMVKLEETRILSYAHEFK